MEDKILAVEAVFRELDQEVSSFQTWSTLHCKPGCGKCCIKPDIEATILEFLPFALYLYKNNLAFEWLEKIKESESTFCLNLNTARGEAGLCSNYAYRGLVCRLFGYSARKNKYGKKELATCQVIKTEQQEVYQKVIGAIEAGGELPVMHDFYLRLHGIDFELAKDFFPVNQAIKRAIETILHYFAYR